MNLSKAWNAKLKAASFYLPSKILYRQCAECCSKLTLADRNTPARICLKVHWLPSTGPSVKHIFCSFLPFLKFILSLHDSKNTEKDS